MNASRRVTANTATFSCSLATVAAVAGAAGYKGLELWSRDFVPTAEGCDEAARLLQKHELAVSALQLLRDFEGCPAAARPAKFQEVESLMGAMTGIGATTLLVCASVDPESSGDPAGIVADLRELANMAAARHLRIAFEPLTWSRWLNNYALAWKCVEDVDHDSLGLAIDCFHLFYQKTDLRFLHEFPISKCLLVQLCDAVPMQQLPAIEIARHHRLFPGEGAWPIRRLVQILESRGYDGYYNMEVMNDRYLLEDPQRVAERGISAFHHLLRDPNDFGATVR